MNDSVIQMKFNNWKGGDLPFDSFSSPKTKKADDYLDILDLATGCISTIII